ncbi:ABC transporter substrate-binding protein [Rhizobium sp. 25PS6]|uniref:ABC transporter substrate-binding protein n=1 Tax=Rhizobium hidalgonense TaxID=1538159 RepID=A0AAJ2H1S5_9HYPH|nr:MULTISPECIES: ABC transporter substrate-binding protein [Rhizobium]MDR9776323.1 ABC transporter substrate-binding protein [Rhizobium hidalgonense]MDR9815042.1 ABC transporter substrate-binding protein [Rhizobium hidalgonense]MDR9822771.1 ABC transporter substrate-binding protein [Rhizobium hidalgonense]MDU0364787.1 ABC transporter substrate-binding protein [Rhizobium sp. 25PS6]NKK47194.1 extracellular solute-binding protein [Rhizobium leguminosarum bv. viciae]
MTTRTISLALSFAAMAVTQVSAVRAEDIPENLKGSGEVVVAVDGGSYEAALRKAFFDPFTKDTGIKIVVVPSNPGKLLASVKVGQPDADLTSVSGGEFPGWISKDAVEPMDYSFFAKETLSAMPEQLVDKNGVGALLYSAVIAFNTNKFTADGRHPDNWVDFYDVKDFPGKRALPKCERILAGGLLAGALLGDGVSPANLYPLDVDRGFAKIKQFRPNVGRWWSGGAEAPQSLISGDADMAVSFNGRIAMAKQEGAPIAFTWNQSLLQYDYWVIMKGSPNKENASKFLAYISRPVPQSQFALAMRYGPVNKEAFGLLPKEIAADLPGAPEIADKQIFENYKWWAEMRPDGRTNYDDAMSRCVEMLSQ